MRFVIFIFPNLLRQWNFPKGGVRGGGGRQRQRKRNNLLQQRPYFILMEDVYRQLEFSKLCSPHIHSNFMWQVVYQTAETETLR